MTLPILPTASPVPTTPAFDTIGLAQPLLDAIRDLGFTHMTQIQAAALPTLLKGHDVAGQAQTGTGKTACFLLGVLETLLASPRPADGSPRALVIAPTRELAMQIGDDCRALSTYTDISHAIICGGLSMHQQTQALERGVDIAIGTPGRLMDMMRQQKLRLKQVQVIVIDEADRMFDMGFIDDLNTILRAAPPPGRRQAMLFSATLSDQVMHLASRQLRNPQRFDVANEHVVSANIEESLFHVSSREKLELLMGLIQKEQPKRTMIFVNRKVDGEYITWKLNHNGFTAVYISGDLPQNKRTRIVEAMKAGLIPILVATDVASRGIHVDDVSHVFNYDLPQDPEDYVHRVGRTARAGATGKAITLACEETVMGLPAVERLRGTSIPVSYAEDADFIPDRGGRMPRFNTPYTGWPPPGLNEQGQSSAPAKAPAAAAEAGAPAAAKKRRRRRRSGGGGGAGGAEAAGGGADEGFDDGPDDGSSDGPDDGADDGADVGADAAADSNAST